MSWPLDKGEDITSEVEKLAVELHSRYGLLFGSALSVARGQRELAIELERRDEGLAVAVWSKTFNYQPGSFKPLWDLDPAHYYLSLDGEPMGRFSLNYPALSLMRVFVAELMPKLQFGSSRDETPPSNGKSVPRPEP